MKTITLQKVDFDDVIYPILSVDAPKSVRELRLCDKILTKLEELGEAVMGELPDGKGGQEKVQVYKLTDISVEVELEDAEAAYLLSLIINVLPKLQARRTRQMLPVINILEAT